MKFKLGSMEARWFLGVGALLLVVIAVIVFLLLPVKESEPVPAEKPPETGSSVPPIGGALTAPKAPALAVDAGAPKTATMGVSSGDVNPIGGGTASVSGRVLVDGKPVTAYGVVITKRRELGMFAEPNEVRSTDGAFAFDKVRGGTWNVLIGGAGFARKMIAGVKLVDGEATDLGDIEVSGGLRITGTVVDAQGRPIAGAKVAIATSGLGAFTITDATTGEVLQKPTAEGESMRGRPSTTTDARGRYRLDGVITELGIRAVWIEASHPTHGASPRNMLPDESGAIDFVLGGKGALDGRITVPLTSPMSVIARRIGGVESPVRVTADAEGNFRFEDLPVGTYRVTARSRSQGGTPVWSPREVVVGANKRASLTLAEPKVVVTLEATVSRMCPTLNLRASADDSFSDSLKSPMCTGNTARFERVEPGTYGLCAMRECIEVEIGATPAVLRVDASGLTN